MTIKLTKYVYLCETLTSKEGIWRAKYTTQHDSLKWFPALERVIRLWKTLSFHFTVKCKLMFYNMIIIRVFCHPLSGVVHVDMTRVGTTSNVIEIELHTILWNRLFSFFFLPGNGQEHIINRSTFIGVQQSGQVTTQVTSKSPSFHVH